MLDESAPAAARAGSTGTGVCRERRRLGRAMAFAQPAAGGRAEGETCS
jgi:hypothetical protein